MQLYGIFRNFTEELWPASEKPNVSLKNPRAKWSSVACWLLPDTGGWDWQSGEVHLWASENHPVLETKATVN